MTADCPRCHGLGYTDVFCVYDCSEPGCTAAADRTALEQAIKDDERRQGPMTREELAWFSVQWYKNKLEK
jgi:hypothetical protein